ncbi:MAG TPA: DUF1049 domain-containing protein [Gammaproteobacteria bacterium]|nr:DUF1049 domain-containing protein [Gammaproteobacteria bacterium]
MNYKMLTVLVLAILVVLFIIQNVAVVEIEFLFWSVQMSRSLLIFILLAVGFVIGWFVHSYFKHKKTRVNQ